MNREDIIRMAREASFGTVWWPQHNDTLERFAELVEQSLIQSGYRKCAVGQRTTQYCGMAEQARREEREECAKMFDGEVWGYDYREIAAAIRARGSDETH